MTATNSAKPDKKTLSTLAKALWKQSQKTAEPTLTPADLRSRWKSLGTEANGAGRKAAKTQARLMLRAIAKAGYALEAAPPKEKTAKKKGKKAGA